MLFIFKTSATMKPHNYKKYWISNDIIGEKQIEADDLSGAIKTYAERVENENFITISKNAIKNRNPMYRDMKNGSAKQIGFVFTAQTDFNDDYKRWVKQYIDLWVEIITVVETNFEAA